MVPRLSLSGLSSPTSSLWKLKFKDTSSTSGITSGTELNRSRLSELSRSIYEDTPSDQLHAEASVSDHNKFRFPSSSGSRRARAAHELRMWRWLRIGLGIVVVGWSTYCAVRYFIALRVYDDDAIRTKYALALGITSTSCTLLYIPLFSSTLFRLSQPRHPPLLQHTLALIAAGLLLAIAILNLILVNAWRTPGSPTDTRTIQGRCHLDVDAIWGGTGLACAKAGGATGGGAPVPFGAWLGAAIGRVVITFLVLTLCHFSVVIITRSQTNPPHLQQASDSSQHTPSQSLAATAPLMSGLTMMVPRPRSPSPSSTPSTAGFGYGYPRRSSLGGAAYVLAETRSEEELQRRSLSFTTAGQVLSRVDRPSYPAAEGEDDDNSLEDERPASTSSSGSSNNSSARGRASPEQDLDIPSRSISMRVPYPQLVQDREKQTVQVLGSYMERMSTIDSVQTTSTPGNASILGGGVATGRTSPVESRSVSPVQSLRSAGVERRRQ